MRLDRRTFLALGIATAASVGAKPMIARAASPWHGIKAVAFDAFTLFDPRPLFQACEAAAPGRGNELANLWRTRQFEYQWLRALAGQYRDFYETTDAALEFAAQSLKIDLAGESRDRLMRGYFELRAWPDVEAALGELRRSGLQLALLSNATPAILDAGLRNSRLTGALDYVISTDRIKSFKPDPRAYQLAPDILGVKTHEIMFVAFAGWDAAGAKWFGYPTFWNNRQGAAQEMLDAKPDGVGSTLTDLALFLSLTRR